MHFCGMVFTKNKPTIAELEEIFAPYYDGEELEDDPIALDYFLVGGRYAKMIPNDCCPVCDIEKSYLDDLHTYFAVDIDGRIDARQVWNLNTHNWEDRDTLYERFEMAAKAKARKENGWITIVDCHD